MKGLVPFTTKLDPGRLRALRVLSEATRVPQSMLVREAIDLLLVRHKEDVLSRGLKDDIEVLLKEDLPVLKRLA